MNKGIILAIASILTFSSCHSVSPNADEETVLVKKPWFFGHGGVDMTPCKIWINLVCFKYSWSKL